MGSGTWSHTKSRDNIADNSLKQIQGCGGVVHTYSKDASIYPGRFGGNESQYTSFNCFPGNGIVDKALKIHIHFTYTVKLIENNSRS